MRSDRNDISDFFNFWQIDRSNLFNQYYMLAYTQGLLPTDTFEFLADFNPVLDLSFITEIAGLSKYNLPNESLSVGDFLLYEKESSNDFDDKAVKLLKDNLELGYIKKNHSRVFFKFNQLLKVRVHHIEKNGKISRVFLHITTFA